MPKPIKKKIVKPTVQQEDIKDIMSRFTQNAAARKKQIAIGAATAVVILLIALGAYLINSNATSRASAVEAQGYNMFLGLYDTQSMPKTERMEKALASFRDANATRPTPFRQYYIAATLYELGRYDECITELDALASKYSSNNRFIPVAKLKKTQAFRAMGNNEKALETLREFSFISGKTLKDVALMETAELLEQMGNENEAQQYYDLLLKEHPESRLASIAQGRLKLPEMQQQAPAGAGAQPPFKADQPAGNKPLSIELN